jgi:hypothetical protein
VAHGRAPRRQLVDDRGVRGQETRALRLIGALLVGLIAAGTAFWALDRGRDTRQAAPGPVPSRAAADPAEGESGPPRPDSPEHESLAQARARYEGMSPTFRNTSFLIAIRDAGYECTELLDVNSGGDNAPWRVACAGAIAYLVGVDAAGGLNVAPVPYAEGGPFFDTDPERFDPDLTRPVPAPPNRDR